MNTCVAESHARGRCVRTILLVDDEPFVLNVVSMLLGNLGYEVITASTGENAVCTYQQHVGQIDLVIIDMVMPGMDGAECFQAIRQVDPDVKAVLSSGYARNGRMQQTLEDGMIGFLDKPYDMAHLATLLERAASDA